jgi:hypothetical protein
MRRIWWLHHDTINHNLIMAHISGRCMIFFSRDRLARVDQISTQIAVPALEFQSNRDSDHIGACALCSNPAPATAQAVTTDDIRASRINQTFPGIYCLVGRRFD